MTKGETHAVAYYLSTGNIFETTHAHTRSMQPRGIASGERDEMDCSQKEHRSPLSDLPVGGEQEQNYTETNAR